MEALAFAWRWTWRITLGAVALVVGLIALLYLHEWAKEDQTRWGFTLLTGFVGVAVAFLWDIRNSLNLLLKQNEEMLRDLRQRR